MNQTIIALDFGNTQEALQFLDQFQKPIFVKVGMELAYATKFEILEEIKKRGHSIFLDVKLHDIPNTVRSAMRTLAQFEIDMINCHASGGKKMMQAALEGLKEGSKGKRPKLIAVTQLTSTSKEVMNDELGVPGSVVDSAVAYASLAKESGLDGVVCSVYEAARIHQIIGADFLTVTPGIRLEEDDNHDQKRVATPAFAKKEGCDYIVVGRSITKSDDPITVYEQIEDLMEGRN